MEFWVFHDFPLICGFQSVFLLIQDVFRHFGPHFAAFSQGLVPSSPSSPSSPVVPVGPVGAMAEIVVCSATSGEELVALKLEDLEILDSRNDVTPCESLMIF